MKRISILAKTPHQANHQDLQNQLAEALIIPGVPLALLMILGLGLITIMDAMLVLQE